MKSEVSTDFIYSDNKEVIITTNKAAAVRATDKSP